MKPHTLATGTLGLAGLVTLGLLALPGSVTSADDPAVKRDEDTPDVVLVADDDDDDTNTRSRSKNTGNSRSRADGTNSRKSAVSRDRDRSRGDRTKDWTRDGGDRTRDHSRNHTNDGSRNDTR